MRIDHCLIMSAGFGTRMGDIGKQLPKVLWPVFEKSLLELQVAYARSLGIEKIYINLHYIGEQIEEFCKSRPAFEGVQFLWEKPEILDIGGAVHNLAAQPKVQYKGKLLVLNADQFFYLRKEEMGKILKPYEKSPVVLFTYKVDSSLGYNALNIDSDRLVKGITQNKDLAPNQAVETYTGISLVDLAQLTKTPGASRFFESVSPLTKKDIPGILLDKVEYWDFGTLERYWRTSFHILQTYTTNPTHPFIRFLVQEKAVKTWKIHLQNISYNAKSPRVINLNPDKEEKDLSERIILSGQHSGKKAGRQILWNDQVEEIK